MEAARRAVSENGPEPGPERVGPGAEPMTTLWTVTGPPLLAIARAK